LSSVNVYSILISGWASNSRYSFLGSLRAAAQMISYEVTLGVILLHVVCITKSFNLTEIVECQIKLECWFIFPLFPSFVLFFIAALAETNRAPFDFPEAESELVSGYNTEHASITFALFFLGEYANILLLCNFMVILFLGGWGAPFGLIFLPPEFWYSIKYFFVLTPFMIVRSTLPRYRYDLLMRLGWKVYVPVSIFYLLIGFLIHFVILPS
jgi:NADH-quinone oxidoreductase subunit H